MSTLTITLTEHRVRGATELRVGIHAQDADQEFTSFPTQSWDAFKHQFPSLKSVLAHVVNSDVFHPLSLSDLKIDGVQVMPSDPDNLEEKGLPYTKVILQGFDGFYDEPA